MSAHTTTEPFWASDALAPPDGAVWDLRVVGATIVGPRAGESLPEVVLAARHGLRARELAAATHAYPTYGDGVWKAGIDHVQHQLHQPGAHRVTSVLRTVRRAWLAR